MVRNLIRVRTVRGAGAQRKKKNRWRTKRNGDFGRTEGELFLLGVGLTGRCNDTSSLLFDSFPPFNLRRNRRQFEASEEKLLSPSTKKRNVAGSPPSVCPSRISWRRPGISQPEGRKRRPKEKTSETQRERKTYLNLDTRKRKERRSCTVNLANKSRPRAR